MDYSKIDLQPLNHYNNIPNYTTRQIHDLHELAKKGDVLAFDVDEKLYYKALVTINDLGYNIDLVLNYIASQIGITTNEIKFYPEKRNKSQQSPWIENLKQKLIKYGKLVDGNSLSHLLSIQTVYHAAYLKDVLNAMFAQIILYKKLSLKIDQSKQTQEKLINAFDYETNADEPPILPITHLNTPDDVFNMFIDED